MFTTWCTSYLRTSTILRIFDDFGKREVTSRFNLGTRSNLAKLKTALIEREIIEQTEGGLYMADPLFETWFKREMM